MKKLFEQLNIVTIFVEFYSSIFIFINALAMHF